MERIAKLIFGLAVVSVLGGCVAGITRQETDIYTISERDTTTLFLMQNAPGNRDNGLVYPSSRTFKSERYLIQRDSIVDRFYPNFIRFAAFESVGLMFSSDGNHSYGTGLFGIFPPFDKDFDSYDGDSSSLFQGGIYRIGVGEWRLRWFRDSKNWTIGSSLYEGIYPDARIEKGLSSMIPLYLRKRYFLREEIPYVAVTGSFGVGLFPSQYVNMSASLDVGSIAGLNIRAYAGLAAGYNAKSSTNVQSSGISPDEAQSMIFPYLGLGISLLDFLNIVPETEIEWKDHQHSGWDIGLMQLSFVASNAENSALTDSGSNNILDGVMLKIANAAVALPLLDYKVYAGTSLINFLIFGNQDWGIGILPLRVGLWQTIIQDELSIDPFVELNYYPSSIFHAGARLNLRITEQINLGAVAGYASGSTSITMGNNLTGDLGNPGKFSTIYFGISVGVLDKIFFPENLRYNKK